MGTYHATAVSVMADIDHGEGWIDFVWPDDLLGWERLLIDLYGHCSRRMPVRSGVGLDQIELARDRVRLRFTPELAEKLVLDQDIEILISIDDLEFVELRKAVEFLGGTVTEGCSYGNNASP